MSQKEKSQRTIPVPVITERKEAEPTPKENQEWFRLLVETSLDYIFQTDEQGRTIYCSPSIEHVLGYHPEEREGTQFSSILLPSELPKARALFKRVMKGEVVQNLGIEAFHKNGRTVPLEISVTPLVENKEVTGMFGIARDITERKQTEELYRTLTGSSPIGIYVVQKGKFVFTNPQFQEDTGYGGDELLGMDALNIVLPEDRNMVRENAISVLKGERSGHYEYRAVSRVGDIRWILETVASIQHQGKRATLGNYMDITERKQMEEALRESEERYRAIVELGGKVGEAIIMLQDTEQGDAIHTFVSEQWTHITGYSQKELLGMSFFDILHPRFRETSRKRHQRKVSGEIIPGFFEMSIIKKDGTEVPIELTSAYTTYEGEYANVAFVRDITERKRTEEALKNSEESYRNLVQSAPDIICTLSLDGTVSSLNPAFETITGWSHSDMMGKHFTSLIHPDDLPLAIEMFQSTVAEKDTGVLEMRVITKTGENLQVEVRPTPLMQNDRIVGFLAIAQVITERKQAEEALRNSEEKYRSLVENATDFIFMIDENDIILSLNKSGANLFRKEPVELIGKTMFEVFPTETATQFSQGLKEVFETGRTRVSESKMIAGEQERWISTSLNPVKDQGGKVEAVMGVTRDITERKQMEHELNERIKELQCLYAIANTAERPGITLDELYQEAVRLLPAGWQYPEITCARIIIDDRKFQTWNYTETEWKQSSDIKVNGANVGAVEVDYLAERPEVDEGPFSREERLLIDAVALQLGRVTERKQMQQELMEKTSQLEKASQAKSEFLAGMSHELRTPLNAVIGFSELMLDGIPGDINDEQRQCLSDVLNSGQHLLNLVNDVLDIAKVEAGRVDLKLENLNLPAVINDVLQTVKPMLDTNRHRMKVNIKDGLPQVRADEHRLRQIFFNLLSNAIKFTPPGGAISIEVSRADDWCHISVVDNGIGIKKEDRERVFEAFTQVDTLPGKEKGGAGLGLALTRELVEMCGGRIWVESEYEKGSRFTFTLPLIVEDRAGLS